MHLTSPQFESGDVIPSKYTCDGEGISPPIEISDVPEGTKSLVLIMDDPDAIKPAGIVWDHWVAFNIPPETGLIEEGQDPTGVMGSNTREGLTYGCPAPPDAEHHYVFRLYALDTMLDLETGATKTRVLEAMTGHILGEANLIGRYGPRR